MGWGVHDYPVPPDPPVVLCPECGRECDTIYTGVNGEVLGCDNCVTKWDAYDWKEENLV